MKKKKKKQIARTPNLVFVSACEPSGDARAASLIKEALKINPDLKFFGLGGPLMKGVGVELLYDMTTMAHLGLGDVLRNYFKYRKIFYRALREVRKRRFPSCLLLVDSPGFNLRFAKKIKKQFPVLYYVSPQIWAWGKRRVKTIVRVVNKMLLLFDFEKKVYEDTALETEVVGNPLLDQVAPSKAQAELKKEWGLTSTKQVIALLPGSREKEIKRIFPVMLEACAAMRTQNKNIEFVLSRSPNLPNKIFENALKKIPLPLKKITGRSYDVVEVSDMALVTSGTATLETALLLKPFLILYRAGFFTYQIAKRVIKIPYIGLVNVIAGRVVIPEFLQNDAKPETVAHEAIFTLREPMAQKKIIENLKEVKEKVGRSGADKRAGEALVNFLKKF